MGIYVGMLKFCTWMVLLAAVKSIKHTSSGSDISGNAYKQGKLHISMP